MGNEIHVIYTQLVEKLEYQNREAAEHDHALKKGVFRLKQDIIEGQSRITTQLKELVRWTKVIILMQVVNLGANGVDLPTIIKSFL